MELTREEVDNYSKCDQRVDCEGICSNYDKCQVSCGEADTVVLLAKQLLAEMDKPGVWDGAPDGCDECAVYFVNHGTVVRSSIYTRELPKSRERRIAEEYFELESYIGFCELALLKYKAELEAGR